MENIMRAQTYNIFKYNHSEVLELWLDGYMGEGEYRMWYKMGSIYRTAFYKDKKREGTCTEYYDNGKIYRSYNCRKDRLHGELKKWNDKCKLIEHSWYENNVFRVNFITNPELKEKYL